MSYQKVYYRRHGFNWLPLVVLALFFLWGGWKLLFLLPLFIIPLAIVWFFMPKARRWRSEYRHGDWGNWNDWSGFDGEKRKNGWQDSDDEETEGGRIYEAKRKNDDDVYYV